MTPEDKSQPKRKGSWDEDEDTLSANAKNEGGLSDSNRGLDKYHEDVGLVTTLDLVAGLPRQVRSLKIVYSAFKGPIAIGDRGLAGPTFAEPDKNFRELNRVLLSSK